jgi:Spy/CpxP family protein refolding chaperone
VLSSKIRVAAVLAGLLLAPALSFAQAPSGGRGGFGRGGFGGFGISGLLVMEEVQKEISLTDEQKAELTKINEAARPAAGAAGFDREAFQKLTEEERTKRFEEMRKEGEERAKKTEEAIKTLLKPEQLTRLNELRVQREGTRAWSREDVQKELGLTAEQIAKIKSLNEGLGQGGFGGFGGRPNPDQSEEEARKAREERDAKRASYEKDMAAVLTADQTAAWTKMQGAKFEFPARGGFGGGTGGRGGRPGGATGNARPPAN